MGKKLCSLEWVSQVSAREEIELGGDQSVSETVGCVRCYNKYVAVQQQAGVASSAELDAERRELSDVALGDQFGEGFCRGSKSNVRFPLGRRERVAGF